MGWPMRGGSRRPDVGGRRPPIVPDPNELGGSRASAQAAHAMHGSARAGLTAIAQRPTDSWRRFFRVRRRFF